MTLFVTDGRYPNRYVLWTLTNMTKVIDKLDILIQGHYEIKGQTNAFRAKKHSKLRCLLSISSTTTFNWILTHFKIGGK